MDLDWFEDINCNICSGYASTTLYPAKYGKLSKDDLVRKYRGLLETKH